MKNQIDKSVWITLIIVAGAIAISLVIYSGVNLFAEKKTVSAEGRSEIKVQPDVVGIYFNIQTEGKTADEARNKNSEIVEKMKSSLKEEGFSDSEIQTQSFNIYPKYDYSGRDQRITGYTATHSIRVEVDAGETEKIGKAIDRGVDAGAGINYINYELDPENQKEYKTEAIRLATEDARAKAKALAEGAGQRLGDIVSVSTSDFGYSPWRIFSAEGSATAEDAKASTDIQPSEQTINARVTAVFEIR